MSLKKEIFTVCVDNYRPELCSITLPYIEKYAKRIGAKFTLITERQNILFPPTYEKVQAHKLGQDNDWSILIDADMLVGEDFPDVTEHVRQDSVGVQLTYQADLLFAPHPYFLRDGRRIGLASNFMVVPRWCHDVLTPLPFPIVPSQVTKREFILDEYCFSLNLAKYGLKVTSICENDDLKKILHLNVTSGKEKDAIEKATRWLKGERVAWPWQEEEGTL